MKLWIDYETYSEVDIRAGTHAYAESAEIMLFAYAVDNDPVQVWDLTDGSPMPADLHEALFLADEVWAHNSHFDRTVMRHVMPTLCPPIERWRDTMVQALAHSLPGALGALCEVMGLPADQQKDKRGKALIQLFCKPLPKNRKLRRATRETHPAEWAQFVSYARDDIVSMRALQPRMPMWNYHGSELALWHLDQHINDRGVQVDTELVNAAMNAVAAAQVELAEQTVELTDGAVGAATQRNALMAHIESVYGVIFENMQASTLERKLEDEELPEQVKALIRVRLQATTSSTAKYKALRKAVSRDGRIRGLLQFCGASRTARWAGRTFQPQNLPRPSMKDAKIEEGIVALKGGYAELIHDAHYIMTLTSSAIRGCLIAAPGKKMPIADLSNIEGRMLAWLAGEEWKLQAFRDFDTLQLEDGGWITGDAWTPSVLAGLPPLLALDRKGEPLRKGHDLYALAYAKSFGVTPEAVMENKKSGDGNMRQIGKVQELALGYQGGVGAFYTFAAAYRIDLEDLGRMVTKVADPELIEAGHKTFDWFKKEKRDTFGLSEQAFAACDAIKRAWRNAHPMISSWWPMLENAFRDAIDNPGYEFHARTVKVVRPVGKSGKASQWVTIVLPSGRRLCYPSARIEQDGTLSYMGINQFTRKWTRLKTYAGKLAENVTQAAARDCLAHNMPTIDAAGYAIILSVHDELLTDTPDTPDFSSEILAAHMSTVPPWCPGLPLAAAGFETYRYKKD